jgi:alkanesulfonate monooxygenase SsuD/methylene tetrahydromethanopterin reductase-like flavin-dependent oxidoreductase (luciferase family)
MSTGVTNPLTRHPAVAASAIASIQQVSGGRAVLGIGRGDSALAYVGHAPVHIEVLKRYIEAVQTYLRGEAVSFDDLRYWQQMAPRVETLQLADTPEDSRLVWLTPEDTKVPVEVVATGPNVIAAASRHADHVMFALGADTERVEWGLEEARSARREAGLDPNGIKFGVYINVVCHPHLDVARELLSELDTFARFSVMHGKTFGPISRREQEVLTRLHRSYNMRDDGSDYFRRHRPDGRRSDRRGRTRVGTDGARSAARLLRLGAPGAPDIPYMGPSGPARRPNSTVARFRWMGTNPGSEASSSRAKRCPEKTAAAMGWGRGSRQSA